MAGAADSKNIFSLLKTESRDYVVNHAGDHIQVDSLKKAGTYIAVYFSAHWCPPCRGFTPVLSATYKALQAEHKSLEVIFVSSDSDKQQFKEYFESMPWLALPYEDRDAKDAISNAFNVEGIPTLIVFDDQGQMVNEDGREVVTRYGAKGYPYTAARGKELAEEKEKMLAALKLEDLLKTEKRDYLVNQKQHVPVASLRDKVVGVYFSAHWCGPCRMFTPELIKVHQELKEQKKPFEIVFVSSDRDQAAFDEYYGSMPWLALPYEDRASKDHLSQLFEVQGIPTFLLFDQTGTLLTKTARGLISEFGAKAYPFTKARVEELKAEQAAKFAKLPQQVTDPRHPHPLTLMPSVYGGSYGCDGCKKGGSGYAYHCEECGFDLHPGCAQGNSS